ncbi:phosphoglycerate kinase [Patescibacteria group bacterium]
MELPKINNSEISGKKVIVRADLDIGTPDGDSYRLEAMLPTLRVLFESNCEIVLCGHRGRPGGKEEESLSLKNVGEQLENLLKQKWGEEDVRKLKMQLMENIRFNEGEEKNDEHFAKHLAEKGEYFVNEAFAASHRKHASIVLLPKLLPHAFGIRFIEEVENLSKVINNPVKPVLLIVGGIKKDKQENLKSYASFADKVLVAGRLPVYIGDESELRVDERYKIAKLLPDKEDMTIHSIEDFEEEIKSAKTIILAGPMGKFEETGHMMGTKRVFEAVANSSAQKIAGGGNTIHAIEKLNLKDKFDWISVGGGAVLEFLKEGTLVGIKAQTS